jgi:hypothetical protein
VLYFGYWAYRCRSSFCWRCSGITKSRCPQCHDERGLAHKPRSLSFALATLILRPRPMSSGRNADEPFHKCLGRAPSSHGVKPTMTSSGTRSCAANRCRKLVNFLVAIPIKCKRPLRGRDVLDRVPAHARAPRAAWRQARRVGRPFEGIKGAVSKVLNATWQRCRVHFMRNALAHAGKSGRSVVSAFIGTAFAQDDAGAARLQWRRVADQLRRKLQSSPASSTRP